MMEPRADQQDIDRLIRLLEEVRLLLATALPRTSPPPKKLSWDDVWRNGSYVVRPRAVKPPAPTPLRTRPTLPPPLSPEFSWKS